MATLDPQDYRTWPTEAQLALRDRLRELIGDKPTRPNAARILVNKRTQRIRFENETETEVVVVIESKDSDG